MGIDPEARGTVRVVRARTTTAKGTARAVDLAEQDERTSAAAAAAWEHTWRVRSSPGSYASAGRGRSPALSISTGAGDAVCDLASVSHESTHRGAASTGRTASRPWSRAPAQHQRPRPHRVPGPSRTTGRWRLDPASGRLVTVALQTRSTAGVRLLTVGTCAADVRPPRLGIAALEDGELAQQHRDRCCHDQQAAGEEGSYLPDGARPQGGDDDERDREQAATTS